MASVNSYLSYENIESDQYMYMDGSSGGRHYVQWIVKRIIYAFCVPIALENFFYPSLETFSLSVCLSVCLSVVSSNQPIVPLEIHKTV